MAKKRKTEKKPREYSKRQLSSFRRQQRRQRFFLFGGITLIVAILAIILGGWIVGEYIPLHKTVLEVFDKKFDTAYYVDMLALLSKVYSSSPDQISTTALNQIMQDELLIQEAAKFGVVVSDEEATQSWQAADIVINQAAIDFAKGQLLPSKLKSEYFSSFVAATANQVHVRAMLVESDAVASMLRERIINGENFTSLAEEYAQNTPSQDNKGDFGWHPVSILKELLAEEIPIEYVSSPDVNPGDVSPPLSDNESSKKLGYWLIRVNERPSEDTANVSAIYLSSEAEALEVRTRLEMGEELAPIAGNLSQYNPSQQNLGELGLVQTSQNTTYSETFMGYVFSPETEVGVWSQPLRDENYWTRGGAWVVQLVDRDENRQLSIEDRDELINQSYSDWWSAIWQEYSPLFLNNLDADLELWAVERASREL